MRGRLDKQHLLARSKKFSMQVVSSVLRRTWLYNLAGRMARVSLRWLPRFAVYNPLNVWGRRRELPDPPAASFRELYAKHQQPVSDDSEKRGTQRP
jgi:L-lactate dehydrogenase complex protein LldF